MKMEITEVRIFLKDGNDKKLKAYATVTFDNAFVVRNIKVIEGQKGLFVAMPSRKLTEPCPKCNFKNAVRSKFCNNCGASLPIQERHPVPQTGGDVAPRDAEHRDIAHPITLECREYLQKKVLEAYETERKKGGTVKVEKETPPQPKKEEKKNLDGDLEF
ncbi:MAG: septation protein SpoVG family protein [Candidatus Omnitrophica bacterium]|nr:septation protein SpoVG family protein [Candidatus Omnitrophota bacterium]